MADQSANDPFADGSPGGIERDRDRDRRTVGEPERRERPSAPERTGRGGVESGPEPSSRLLAVIVGGAVTFVAGIVPILGPMIGGGVAGYLRGSDTKESALTGALAGLAASVPATLVMLLLVFLAGIGGIAEGDGDVFVGIAFLLFLTAVSLAYMMACAAIGGAIGAELTDRRAPS